MLTEPPPPAGRVAELREAMVTALVENHWARSPEIIRALRVVPRHVVEGVDAERVYDPYKAAVTKRAADGTGLSSVSAAQVQAMQLEQAGVRPGQRVLEVGSGGVNAAYLAELAGPSGLIVTMDIDPEVTARARQFLGETGYGRVEVVTGDASRGLPRFAPFDLIMVTVETTDVPDAWWDQLTGQGRIVAPIRWRGQSRTVCLIRQGGQGADLLAGEDIAPCGFVPMQGLGEDRERVVVLHEAQDRRVTLRCEDDTAVDAEGLGATLVTEKSVQPTGMVLGSGFARLDLWLSTVLDTSVMSANLAAHRAGLVPKPSPIGWPTLVEGTSMAYRTLLPGDEIGVVAHGPARKNLGERYVAAVRSWDPRSAPRLTVTRRNPPPITDLPHRTVQRRTSALTITWP